MGEDVKFEGKGEEKARKIVEWVEFQLTNKKRSVLETAKIGSRTPKEILSNKRVITPWSCLNMATVVATTLVKNGFDAWIVTQRTYYNGEASGAHFMVKGKKGNVKFTVNPTARETKFISGWGGKNASLSMPLKATKRAHHETLFVKKIPPNAENIKAFKLAGVKGKLHYAWLAKPSSKNFAWSVYKHLRFGAVKAKRAITRR